MQIPNHLKELIDYVIEYVDGNSNDWLVIRAEIIRLFPPKDRSLFHRRHFSTKKPIMNEFDEEVIRYWEQKTGTRLFINENKLHSDSWIQKPKGWGLQAYNEQRRKSSTQDSD